MKAYEDHCAREGKPESHVKAKELLYVDILQLRALQQTDDHFSAGFAGAFIDREFETKGVRDDHTLWRNRLILSL